MREHKEEYMMVGKSKARKTLGLDYRMVNKILCSFEGGYSSEESKKEA